MAVRCQEVASLEIDENVPQLSEQIERYDVLRHTSQAPLTEADLRLVEDECIQKLRRITVPALIIHGERDSLVRPEEAFTINWELGSVEKRLIFIPDAGHNSVMAEDIAGYFQAIGDFIHP